MKHSKELLFYLYKTMLRIRYAEESLVEPLIKGDILTPTHLYSGEEAIAAGVCATLTKEDYIFGNHRSHGHYLAKGGSMEKMIAEIYGRSSGCSRGRGGSMHLIDPENGVLGVAPIVAGTVSMALGASLASKIRRDGRVTVSFFGDGATGEGVLYESLNFAALKKLPIIFACENNFYATHLPLHEIRVNNKITELGKPFGIKSLSADGNNVLEVYETAKEAVEICRKDKGPVFIEFQTYRLRGHVGPYDNFEGKHTDIRPKQERESWLKKDPINMFEKSLIQDEIFTPDELSSIKKEVENEVKEANHFAISSEKPDKSELLNYVFKNQETNL